MRIKEKFTATCTRKYRDRDLELTKATTGVKQKYNARGLLFSSMYGQAINDLYLSELQGSAEMLVEALLEAVRLEGKFPNVKKLIPWLSDALYARKDRLERGRIYTIELLKSILMCHSMLEPLRSMDAWCRDLHDETQNQFRNRYEEDRVEHRKFRKKRWWMFLFLIPFVLMGWINEIWEFIHNLPKFISKVLVFF